MAKQDLEKFLYKVKMLQEMVDSLEKIPGRKNLLTACENHEQVVMLAKSWGFEIGRRWGE